MSDVETAGKRRIVLRSLAIWLIVIAAEMIHGMLRAVVLVPWVGEFRSNQIGVFTGSAIIMAIAWMMIRWIGAKETSDLLMVGLIWMTLTLAFEILFGHFVMGMGWERIRADYNIAQGGLMPLGLVVLCISPMIALKLRGKSRVHFKTV
jgi:hypothetical protein